MSGAKARAEENMPRIFFTNLSIPFSWIVLSVLLVMSSLSMIVIAHPDATDGTHQSPHPILEIAEESKLYPAKVIRIFDGDTILIEQNGIKRRIQILAANAPEFIPTDRTPKPFASEARRFLSQLILDEQVFIQYDPASQYDRFDRLAAYVFRAPDMLCINLELIRQAYAKYDVEQDTIYSEVFHHYNSRARILDRGIWNPEGSMIDWHEKTEKQASQRTSRSSKPTTQPEPRQQRPTAPSAPSAPIDPSDLVYITKSGTKYHSKDCAHLSESNKATTRQAVGETHQACKSCDPDG